ncbi:MAG TPA: hypothetical protein VK890_02820, partial [Bacteroidia bacterium]|nr:hypothetical protein [Bacteroidia bacterium]
MNKIFLKYKIVLKLCMLAVLLLPGLRAHAQERYYDDIDPVYEGGEGGNFDFVDPNDWMIYSVGENHWETDYVKSTTFEYKSPDSSLADKRIISTETSFYDKKGYVNSSLKKDSMNKVMDSCRYIFDKHDNLIEVRIYDSLGRITKNKKCKYSSTNKLTYMLETDSSFDAIVDCINHRVKDSITISTTESVFTYNSSDKVATWVTTTYDNNRYRYGDYEDDWGGYKKQAKHPRKKELTQKMSYTYKYDKAKNLVRIDGISMYMGEEKPVRDTEYVTMAYDKKKRVVMRMEYISNKLQTSTADVYGSDGGRTETTEEYGEPSPGSCIPNHTSTIMQYDSSNNNLSEYIVTISNGD